MNELPCEVVRDLLPSYVDGLTSEATSKLVDGHIETCAPCRAALDAMRAPEERPEADAAEPKEIDFLKKNRRHNRAVVLKSIAGALLLAAAVLFVRTFVIARELGSVIAHDIRVDGSSYSMKLSCTDSLNVITAVSAWEDEDGVLWVEAEGTPPSFLHRKVDDINEISGDVEKPIRQVRMGERIFWDDGLNISEQVSRLYATRHDYVGDMPANGRTASALNLQSWFGAYENELLTAERPYVWILRLSDAIAPQQAEIKEREMQRFACAMLALVGNLDEVRFEYRTGDATKVKSVSTEDASAFVGRDIKECGGSPRKLAELMDAVGLGLDGMSRLQIAELAGQESTSIEVVNCTDDTILSLTVAACRNGELCSSHSGQNADFSPLDDGFGMLFRLVPSDFGGGGYEGAELTVRFSLTTADGVEHEADGELRLAPGFGAELRVTLTGNASDGFRISQ